MVPILLVLLLVLILFGAGFAVKLLWWIALAVLVLWLLGFLVRGTNVKVTHIRAIPTWVRHPDFLVLPVQRALRYDRADRAALLASLRRTRSVVGRYAG